MLLLLACTLSVIGRDLDEQFGDLLLASPSFLETLWKVGFWGAETWVLALLVACVVKRRFALFGEALIAAAVALGGASLAAEIVKSDGSGVFQHLVDANGPPVFPHGAITFACAVLATAAPYLTLPLRRLGRCLIAAQLVGSMFLGATLASGAVAAVAIGLIAGA